MLSKIMNGIVKIIEYFFNIMKSLKFAFFKTISGFFRIVKLKV